MRTRFAPSPTGPLHLGHAYSALLASDMAHAAGGAFLLRIEDIDQSRSRPEWDRQIEADLRWLGLTWPEPVLRQSERLQTYRGALQTLWSRGLLYPCTCRRRDIVEALGAPQEGVPHGPDGLIYPGTCRAETPPSGPLPDGVALRLDMRRALDAAGPAPLTFAETGKAHQEIATNPCDYVEKIGDIAVARKDMSTSYHLSVVLDDAAQGITHVVRGEDLFDATAIHVLLQRLLGLPTPVYHHHRLIRDEHGKRLAKRDDSRAIATYRDEGLGPEDIRRLVDLPELTPPAP
ncbi:glutamyl-Q tRNA(Asp) ligase [Roseivivax halodurans JCM 10272]|uniref:Glutamyl-Q tRNA(Asp) ligase n=1 Tax=Roseivivax halodurans JCM 10272 TaxID=1449350 RepID=X7EHI1_9RHOB|nr:glutamyl-Q tRNA(Asp) ligase [Roseivivax halodurans JCM 10272]